MPDAWKVSDAEWFKANPERSHRLRSLFPGEPFPAADPFSPPAGHEMQVLVRQLEPGFRMRMKFCRNTGTPIPDLEPVIHALFDLYSNPDGRVGEVVSVRKVADLALKYAQLGQAAQ